MTDTSEIPRRAIDYAHATEDDIEDRVGKMEPRELHIAAGEALSDQTIKSLETGGDPDKVLLESDALVIEGIQQAANKVDPKENSIVQFDAIGAQTKDAVTGAVKNLAEDELTEPIAQAAVRILDAAETSDDDELPEAA